MGEKRIDICNFYKKEISEPNKNGYPSEMGGNEMGWMEVRDRPHVLRKTTTHFLTSSCADNKYTCTHTHTHPHPHTYTQDRKSVV